MAGKRVLLVDFDPQANATTGFGLRAGDDTGDVYRVLTGETSVNERVRPTELDGLSLLSSGPDLAAFETEFAGSVDREYQLLHKLLACSDAYDFIVMDCAPSLGILTINALVAATHVLIPLQCEFLALDGVRHLTTTIGRVRHHLNPSLKSAGIVLTMFDRRNSHSNQVAANAQEYFGRDIYQTIIPRSIRIAEAPSFGRPVLLYDHRSAGAVAYISLVAEFLRRQREGW